MCNQTKQGFTQRGILLNFGKFLNREAEKFALCRSDGRFAPGFVHEQSAFTKEFACLVKMEEDLVFALEADASFEQEVDVIVVGSFGEEFKTFGYTDGMTEGSKPFEKEIGIRA